MRTSSEIITELLAKRGLTGEDGKRFLHPDFDHDLHDQKLMKGMDLAIPRLVQAVKNKEKIVIFGDYDADGIPATALLVRAFGLLGLEAIPLIPARSDGYGLTAIAVAAILAEHPDLVITVDNGTVSKKEVAELAETCNVIIIDHHEPDIAHLATAALALINPKQADCDYPFKELCAAGLAWKVMVALFQELNQPWEPLKWLLDLVAVATVADMVPLLGENRTLVTYGLRVMAKSRNIGIQALASIAGFDLEQVSAGDIGFKIGPRINAPSRMHLEVVNDKNAALCLLTTNDLKEADTLAHYLNTQNNERQALVDAHLAEAYAQAEIQTDKCALVVFHKDWSTGVIGLVASRLVEKYKRPAIVLAPEGDEIKGSVRSVGDIEALAMLNAASQHLERFGGHAKAAGLTLKDHDIAAFAVAIHGAKVFEGRTPETIAALCYKEPDMVLTLGEANLELAQKLQELAPYGMGFSTPLFRTTTAITSCRQVGKEKQHLSCFLEEGSVKRKAIAFRQPELEDVLGNFEIDFHLETDEWNNVISPSCIIEKIGRIKKELRA